jgi:hypothetical protein
MRYVRLNDGVFVSYVMAGLVPAIHDFKGRPEGRLYFIPVPGRGVFAGFAFYSLDPAYGRSQIGNIKKATP